MSSSDADTVPYVTYNGINSVKGLQILENSEPVKVSVGSSGNMSVWYLPKKLLVEYSTFFAAALNGGQLGDPPWLYRGCALSKSDSLGYYRDYPEGHIRTQALGDKLGCSKLQDTAISQIIEVHVELCTNAMEINLIHELTAPGSLLREFAFDEFRWDSNKGFGWDEEEVCAFLDMGAITPKVGDKYWYTAMNTSDSTSNYYYAVNPTRCVERYLEDPKFRVSFGHSATWCPGLHQSM